MAGKSPRNVLQKLFNRHPDAESVGDEHPSSDPASPPRSPTSSRGHQHTRSRSASLRETIVSKARSTSKARAGRTSTDQPARNGARIAAIRALDDAPPLPETQPQDDLSTEYSRMTIDPPQHTGPPAGTLADGSRKDAPPRRPRRSDDIPAAPNGQFLTDSLHPRKTRANADSDAVARKASIGGEMISSIRQVSDFDDPQLSRKPDYEDLRQGQMNHGSAIPTGTNDGRRMSSDQQPRNFSRPSIDKALPIPPDEFDYDLIARYEQQEEATKVESALGLERGYMVKDSPMPVNLKGVVDLNNTEDTTVYERWAPAVTHETIVENTHEIRQEVITREIHTHHYYHRILPIIDIEVLPARHFVPMEGGYAEIAEEEVPGRAGKNAQWMIAEMVSKMMPKGQTSNVPRQFTARQFHGTEGDYKEYVTPEGTKRTETTWIYPPELETGGQRTGQTYPFYFNAADPTQHGMRAKLPGGQVIGVSPLLAQQRRQRLGSSQALPNGGSSVASAALAH